MKHEQFSFNSRPKRAGRGQVAVAMRQKSDDDAQRIVISIKQSVAEGRLTVGDRLPPEVDLCKRYSASRHTVRKALMMLEEENLVARFVGRGSFIAGPNAPASSTKDVAIERQNWSLHELTEARMVLEPHLVTLIIERLVPGDLIELDRCLEQLSRCTTWQAFGEAKYAFHLTLVKAAKNSFLTHVFEQMIESRRETGWYRHDPSGSVMDKVKEVTVRECRSILAALRSKDAKAAQSEIENSIVRVLMWINGA